MLKSMVTCVLSQGSTEWEERILCKLSSVGWARTHPNGWTDGETDRRTDKWVGGRRQPSMYKPTLTQVALERRGRGLQVELKTKTSQPLPTRTKDQLPHLPQFPLPTWTKPTYQDQNPGSRLHWGKKKILICKPNVGKQLAFPEAPPPVACPQTLPPALQRPLLGLGWGVVHPPT